MSVKHDRLFYPKSRPRRYVGMSLGKLSTIAGLIVALGTIAFFIAPFFQLPDICSKQWKRLAEQDQKIVDLKDRVAKVEDELKKNHGRLHEHP